MTTAGGKGLGDRRLLLAEEKLIRDMIQKLNVQLNRLKIEELELLSKSRQEQISDATCVGDTSGLSMSETSRELAVDMQGVNSENDHENLNSAELNLNVNLPNASHRFEPMVEEDESDDEVSRNEDLAYFLTDSGNY